MGVKLCVCMPTCNRSVCIARILKEELELLSRTGIDIYIYDSSSDDSTKVLVSDYQSKGYQNLYYKYIDYTVHANKKAYLIFKAAESTGYDYIWMIHDHTYCNDEKGLHYILQALEKGCDFYLLNMQSKDFHMTEIKELDEFLLLGAWPLNSFGASILKIDSFIRGTDWREMSKKYLKKKTLNYAHVGFYFERAAQIADIKICRLELPREYFLDFLRYEKTSWDRGTIRICTECWGSNILGLPDIYKKKYEALKTQDKWFLSKYKLIFYKKSGQFTVKSFMRYRKWFRLMSPETYLQNFLIAILPFRTSKYIFCHKLVKRIKKARRENQNIFIYGAGRHAVECADLLNNIGQDFDAFIVTSTEGNPETLAGRPVVAAEAAFKKGAALIIIAVLTSGVHEVEKYIGQLNGKSDPGDCIIFE